MVDLSTVDYVRKFGWVRGFISPPEEDFRQLSDGRGILSYPVKNDGLGCEDLPFRNQYYKGVWLVQLLSERYGKRYFYPTLEDLNKMRLETDVRPKSEGTRTLVLIPNEQGRLTERASTPQGKELSGYKFPMVSEDFIVRWNEQRDELDHLEINPHTLRPYPEFDQAIAILNGWRDGLLYANWEKGLPVAFSKEYIEKSPVSVIINLDGFKSGESPIYIGDGFWYVMMLGSDPLSHDWSFRLGKRLDYVRVKIPISDYQKVKSLAEEIGITL